MKRSIAISSAGLQEKIVLPAKRGQQISEFHSKWWTFLCETKFNGQLLSHILSESNVTCDVSLPKTAKVWYCWRWPWRAHLMGFSAAKQYMMLWQNSHYRSSQNTPWSQPENLPKPKKGSRIVFLSHHYLLLNFRGVYSFIHKQNHRFDWWKRWLNVKALELWSLT